MKIKLLLLLVCGAIVRPLQAQFPVTDVGVIAGQAAELARFIEMVNNQYQQIMVLTNQLTQLEFLARILGDPATIRTADGLPALLTSLSSTGSNVARIALVAETTALEAQQYSGGGLFRAVGDTFRTRDGDVLHRQDDPYKPIAAIFRAVANHDAVEQDVLTRRQHLRTAIQQTLTALLAATTDAEAQKLHGVLLGQLAELQTTDHELSFAAQRTLIQDIEARNDRQRQEAAAHEEQATEFHQTLEHLGQWLRPPTRRGRFNSANP